jgi:ATP-binding cassette subfamily C protein CydC
MGTELARQSAGLRARIIDYLQGLPEILIYDAEEPQMSMVCENTRALIKTQYRMSHLTGLSTAMLTLLSGLTVPMVLYVGIGMMEKEVFDGAQLAFITLGVMASFEAVWPLPNAFQYLERTRVAGKRLMEFANADLPVSFPPSTSIEPVRFDLDFEQIDFGYIKGSSPTLQNVNFRIGHGQRVAILGESGSGKSTLVNLLARFWEPDGGRIRMGGVDVRQLSEPDLRRWVCIISQQAHIFNTSLRNNLLLARPDASKADLLNALASVKLLEFVESLPDGLDTWVGEAGRLLSGGQARRLAVARAFLQDAPIWVLDEPTEGLDRATAQELRASIFRKTAHKTVLWITHRRVDVEKMDGIVLLESGQIVAQGPHTSLLAENSRYQVLLSRDYLS